MNPDVPGAAYDAFLRDVASSAAQRRLWTPEDGPMPALYLSHGAPPLLDDPLWIDQLFDWAQKLPVPRSILIVSAHWEAAPVSLSATGASTPLVYDFGGFAPRYYTERYETPDAALLAARVAAVFPDTEPVHVHPNRGLDHGAWVPLKAMYPHADVPVLQLSLPTNAPDKLLDLGRRLRELRSEGVLLIGSGFLTHGLQFATREMFYENQVPGWSSEFDAWAAEALDRGDVDTLADFKRAPGMPYAHPTVEHFTPLFVTLGAATDPEAPALTAIDGFKFGFAKRSLQVA